MAVKVTVYADAAHDKLEWFTKEVQEEAQNLALKKAALVVEREAKKQLTKNGRHPRGTATPSMPGSPPSIITGSLRASVKTFPVTRPSGFDSYQIMIGPTMVYARVQELGGGNNLPPRPYMAPAIEQTRDTVREVYIATIKGYIN